MDLQPAVLGARGARRIRAVMAAPDVEEQVVNVYAELVRRPDKLAWSEVLPAEPLGGPGGGVD